MTTTGWIVVAVIVVLLVIGLLVWLGRNQRNKKLHGEAEQIREDVEQKSVHVRQREALADETAAKARAAQAEAEAKAAEARRLSERAGVHRESAVNSRDELDERRTHADNIDPLVKNTDQDSDADLVANQDPNRVANQDPNHAPRHDTRSVPPPNQAR